MSGDMSRHWISPECPNVDSNVATFVQGPKYLGCSPQVVDQKSEQTSFTPDNPSNFEAIGVKSALSLSAGVSRWTSIPALYDLSVIFPTFLSHMYLLCVSGNRVAPK